MQPSQQAQLLLGVALSLILGPAQGAPAGSARPLIIADGCVIAKIHILAPHSQRGRCAPMQKHIFFRIDCLQSPTPLSNLASADYRRGCKLANFLSSCRALTSAKAANLALIKARDCCSWNCNICLLSLILIHGAADVVLLLTLAGGLHAPAKQKQLQAVYLIGEGQDSSKGLRNTSIGVLLQLLTASHFAGN